MVGSLRVIMGTNEIDQCTTIRLLGQIQQKSTKEKEDIHFNGYE
jgi:hypothetical protein